MGIDKGIERGMDRGRGVARGGATPLWYKFKVNKQTVFAYFRLNNFEDIMIVIAGISRLREHVKKLSF